MVNHGHIVGSCLVVHHPSSIDEIQLTIRHHTFYSLSLLWRDIKVPTLKIAHFAIRKEPILIVLQGIQQ